MMNKTITRYTVETRSHGRMCATYSGYSISDANIHAMRDGGTIKRTIDVVV